MSNLKKLRNGFIRAILFGRFEPIETTLSASAFIHGMIMVAHNALYGPLLGGSSIVEFFVGSALILSGASIIRSICKDYRKIRRVSAFSQFMSWTLLSVLILSSPTVHYLLHFGYATLSAIAAFLYLNLSLGDDDD